MSERSRQALASSTQRLSSDLITATLRNSSGPETGGASSSHPERHSGSGQHASKGRRSSRVREAHESDWVDEEEVRGANADGPSGGRSSRSRPRHESHRLASNEAASNLRAGEEEDDHDFQFDAVVIPQSAVQPLPLPADVASPPPKLKQRTSARHSVGEPMSFTAAEASRPALRQPRVPLHAASSGSRHSAALAGPPGSSSIGALSLASLEHMRDNVAAAPEPVLPVFKHSVSLPPTGGGVTSLAQQPQAQQQRIRRPESIVTVGRQLSAEPPPTAQSSSQSAKSPALRSVTSPLHVSASPSFRLGSPAVAPRSAGHGTGFAAAAASGSGSGVNATLASMSASAWTPSRNSTGIRPGSPRMVAQRAPCGNSGRRTPPPSPPPPPPSATKPRPAPRTAYANRTGFINDGNTCYAASVLSMLLRLNDFQEGLEGFMRRYRSVLFRHRLRREVSTTPPPTPLRTSCRGGVAFDTAVDDANATIGTASPTTAAVESYSMLGPSVEASDEPGNDVMMTQGSTDISDHFSAPSVAQVAPLHHALAEVTATLRSTHMHDTIDGVSMAGIANAMSRYPLGDMFFDGDQHDAHEFFVSLVALLEAEAVSVMKRKLKKQMRIKRRREEGASVAANDVLGEAALDSADADSLTVALEDVWINQLLQGSMCNLVACRRAGCELLQVTSEHFVNVSLTIPDPQRASTKSRGTAALLQESLAPVALDDYKCDKCHVKRYQYQGACVSRAPRALVVQWKRFEVVRSPGGGFGVRKDMTPVEVDRELVLVERDKSNAQGIPATSAADGGEEAPERTVTEVTYALRSVVVHVGPTLGSGHYLCAFWDDSAEEEEAQSDDGVDPHAHRSLRGSSGTGHRWMVANDDLVQRMDDAMVERLVRGERVPPCYLAVYVEVRRMLVPDVGQGVVRFVPPVVEEDAELLSREATSALTSATRLDSGISVPSRTTSTREPGAQPPHERSPIHTRDTVAATPSAAAASRPKRRLLPPCVASSCLNTSQAVGVGDDDVESLVATPPSPTPSRSDTEDVVL